MDLLQPDHNKLPDTSTGKELPVPYLKQLTVTVFGHIKCMNITELDSKISNQVPLISSV